MNVLIYIPPPPKMAVGEQLELPIGALFIGTYAKHAGHNVKIIDGLASNSFAKASDGFVPDVVGISMLTMYSVLVMDDIRKFLAEVRKVSDPVIVCGGPGSSVMSEAILNDRLTDYVVFGPGEDVFIRLLSALESGSPVSDISDIAYLDGGGSYVKTPRSKCGGECLSLQTDYSLMDITRYINYSIDNKKAVAVCASRGCVNRCTFCYNEAFFGCSFQARPVSVIIAEMKALNAQYGVSSFRIPDECFGIDKAWLYELCNAILAELPPVTWWCMTRGGMLTREDYELMLRAGCQFVMFGIETADPQMSRKINKNLDFASLPAEIQMLYELGLMVVASFIMGFPGETPEQMRRTCDFMMSCKVDWFYNPKFYLIPDTKEFEALESSGRVTTPKTIAEFQAYLADYISPKLYPNYSEIPNLELNVVCAFTSIIFRFAILFEKGKMWDHLKLFVNARLKGSGGAGLRYLIGSLAYYLYLTWLCVIHPLIRKKYGLLVKNFQRYVPGK